jgi:hypothetical protein
VPLDTRWLLANASRMMRHNDDDQAGNLAEWLIEALGEPRSQRRLFQRLIERTGLDFIRVHYASMLDVEQGGGELTKKADRRRTPGGVFLNLVRNALIRRGDTDTLHRVFRATRPAVSRETRHLRAALHELDERRQALVNPGQDDREHITRLMTAVAIALRNVSLKNELKRLNRLQLRSPSPQRRTHILVLKRKLWIEKKALRLHYTTEQRVREGLPINELRARLAVLQRERDGVGAPEQN